MSNLKSFGRSRSYSDIHNDAAAHNGIILLGSKTFSILRDGSDVCGNTKKLNETSTVNPITVQRKLLF